MEHSLPTEGYVKAVQIQKAMNIGRTTFFNLVTKGVFEKPVKLGHRISVWDVAYVRKFIKEYGQAKDA